MSRISEVCLEIRDWPGACGIVLNEAAHCSNHCEPSVGNLLRAQGLLFLGALCHAHGVEKATSRVTDISSGAFTALVIRISMHGTRVLHILPAANFCPVHHKHLHNKQSVGVSDVPVKKRCISPVGERAVNKGIADDFRGSHACNTKHSPARVHELGLLIPRKRSLVLTETKRVEAIIAWHCAVEVLRGSGTGEIVGADCGCYGAYRRAYTAAA
mmetsp:Transcript_9940/g.45270  ORF Transcript_9940/g.45270 Transcript_9940/m.45270 type:complete len:214 (-) Transcript_9940:530-1171(-)